MYNTTEKATNKSLNVKLPATIKNGIYLIKISEGNSTQTSQFILYRK